MTHLIKNVITICLQIHDFVIKSIVSLQVKSIADLLQSSSVIGSALQETETMSFKSLVSEYTIEDKGHGGGVRGGMGGGGGNVGLGR